MARTWVLCTAMCVVLCVGAGAQDRSTPEATVRTFLAAFATGDMKVATSCVKGARISGDALEALSQQIKKEPASLTLSDEKSMVDGASATVTGQVTAKFGKSETSQVSATRLNLILSDGAWQLVPDAAAVQQDNGRDMANALAYMLTQPKVFTRAREAARAVSCVSNMKQVALGMIMFVQDYDEAFKLKPATYKKSLMPYIKSDAVFKCPSEPGATNSYAFNSNLAGVRLAKVRVPAQTVMLYEGKDGKLNFRHDGKATVGFVDGHAKLIDAAAAKKLHWKP